GLPPPAARQRPPAPRVPPAVLPVDRLAAADSPLHPSEQCPPVYASPYRCPPCLPTLLPLRENTIRVGHHGVSSPSGQNSIASICSGVHGQMAGKRLRGKRVWTLAL